MKTFNIKTILSVILMIAGMQFAFVSCSDDMGVESYYTSTADYASDYLRKDGRFEKYIKILERATGENGRYRLMDMLSSYGTYTVFAPTDSAVDAYLADKPYTFEQLVSVDSLKTECDTIALNSIIEATFFTSDGFDNCDYDEPNMLDRTMSIKAKDSINPDTKLHDVKYYINGKYLVETPDDSVKNGVIHVMTQVVGTSSETVAGLFADDPEATLFSLAFIETGWADSLARVPLRDVEYEKAKGPTFEKDSIDWTNNNLVVHTAVEYDNVAYPEHRYFRFTIFVEKNEAYENAFAKYNITGDNDLEKLDALAHALYDDMYPEYKDITDHKDVNNALNRFVAYHILPFESSYYKLTCVDGANSTLAKNFDRRHCDIFDYYRTMAPYSLMRFSFPNGKDEGLYINRRSVQSRPFNGIFVRGAKVASPSEEGDRTMKGVNGSYMYIDDIIAYDRTAQETVIASDHIRLDASTLSPDFMTSGARAHYSRQGSGVENGKYAKQSTSSIAASNGCTCLGFKAGYVTNIDYTDAKTHLHVRPRYLSFWSYQGDEVTIKGRFDLTITLPPVPAGTYEVRFGTCCSFTSRGIMQAYIDGEPQDIPFDMRDDAVNLFGWKSDSEIGDDEAIAAYDKQIHNLRWMKGPGNYGSSAETGGGYGTVFRNGAQNVIRRVLGTFVSDGKSEHTLRLQQKMESADNEMNFDWLELCPSSVYNNPDYPESRY